SMEVPSTTTGMIAEIRVPVGEVVPVGAVVAIISDGSGAPASSQARSAVTTSKSATIAPAATAPSVALSSAAPIKLDPFFEVRTPARNYGPARLPGGTRVSPLARRLAAEAGIDLGQVPPSGPHGRITARDVATAAARAPKAAPAAPATLAAPAPGADQ